MRDPLIQKGNDLFQKGELTHALQYYQKALEASRKSNRPREIAATLGNIGNVYGSLGKLQKATRCYREILNIYKDLGDEWGIGKTLVNMGNLHADSGKNERAEAFYLEGKDILEKLGDRQALSTLFQNLGLLSRDRNQFDDALNLFKKGITHARRAGDQTREAAIFATIAKTHLLMKQPQKALEACQTSLKLATQIENEMVRASALYHMVSAYEGLGDKPKAIELLKAVIRIDEKYNLPKLQVNRERLQKLEKQIQRQV